MLRRMLPILCAASTITALSIPLDSAHAAAPAATARYIVQFRPGVAPDTEVRDARARGVRVDRVYRRAANGMVAELTAAQAAALAADPQVRLIERDGVVRAAAEQGGAPWGLDRSDQRGLPLSGSYTHTAGGGAGVKIYVVDTGVRATHVELAGRVAPGNGFVADGMGSQDCQGHGTHVAAIAAGTTYGIAKGATIVPVRVLDCLGAGSTSATVAGLDWILSVNAGAPAVVNMSLGGPPSTAIDDAVRRVIAAGIPVVVAAGNAAYNACLDSPARVTAAVTVGATQSDDQRAQYSNVGSCVDLFAPGTGITSATWTSDTATAVKNGTSMATPHVSGAAALLIAATPGISGSTVASTLVTNATTGAIPDPGIDSPNRLLYLGGSSTTSSPTTVTPPSVTSTALPGAKVGTAYATGLTATGGTAPYAWTVTAGALPAGLALAANGSVSGTPTAAGTSTFTVRVTDAAGATASASLSIVVAAATTTAAPGGFGKSSPSNGATGRSRSSLTFSWAASSGATGYQVCFDRTHDGLCGASWVSVGNTTRWTTYNLLAETTYSWQVRAVNGGGTTNANAGSWWKFSTTK